MAELKIRDFIEMLNTSTDVGHTIQGVDPHEILVQVETSDGDIFDVSDVKYNVLTRSILIKTSHPDDEQDPEDE